VIFLVIVSAVGFVVVVVLFKDVLVIFVSEEVAAAVLLPLPPPPHPDNSKIPDKREGSTINFFFIKISFVREEGKA
jgi:hypothetical protein